MKPLHEEFFGWLNKHQASINQIVAPSLHIDYEYDPSPEDDYLLMSADIENKLHLNGRAVHIHVPVYASFKMEDGELKLSVNIRDNYEYENSYQELLIDNDEQISGMSDNALLQKIDDEFHKHYIAEGDQVRLIQLLSSIKHDDLPSKLMAMKKN